MKKIIIAMAGLATAIGVAWFSVETNQRPREQQVCVAKDVHEKLYAWIYDDTSRDEMSGKQIRIAAVLSQNSFVFDFPYDGEQHAMLSLRTHPRHGKAAMLRIKAGQIVSKTILVRFDDDAPMIFAIVETESVRTNIVFIKDYPAFAARMKRAQKVRVEFTVYGQGQQVAQFDVSGFNPDFIDKQ